MAEDQKSRDEQIGFHKGALSTLAKEREELTKMVNVVEQIMQMHVSALKEMGVDLVAQAQNVQEQAQPESVPAPEVSSASVEDKLKDWKL